MNAEHVDVADVLDPGWIKDTPPTNVDQMLAERGARYGEFEKLAEISQGLKQIMKDSPSWCDMSHAQRESLDMVCNKLGRILNGDPAYKDSWDDLIGYLTLAANTLDA